GAARYAPRARRQLDPARPGRSGQARRRPQGAGRRGGAPRQALRAQRHRAGPQRGADDRHARRLGARAEGDDLRAHLQLDRRPAPRSRDALLLAVARSNRNAMRARLAAALLAVAARPALAADAASLWTKLEPLYVDLHAHPELSNQETAT